MNSLNSFGGEQSDNLNKSLEQTVTEQGNPEQAARDEEYLNQQAVTIENPQFQKSPEVQSSEVQAPVQIPQRDPRLLKRKEVVKPNQGARQQNPQHLKPIELDTAINQSENQLKDSIKQKNTRTEPTSKKQEISQIIEATQKNMSSSRLNQASATTTTAEMLLPKRPLPLSLTDKLSVAKASTVTSSKKSAKTPAAKPHKSNSDLDEMEILLSKKKRGTLTKPGLGSKKDEENLQM